jgi:Uma2 family endonuclease
MRAAQPATLYDRLLELPEGLTGEILNGQIHTQPRPAGPHARAESVLQIEIGGPFDRGKGGPGGWWILVEPEIHFLRDREVCVPDLAGWRRERMPRIPDDQRFEIVPDWVCEILSPSTESRDRSLKMPIYARHGVAHAWLVDPLAKTLEAFVLDSGAWRPLGTWGGDDPAAVPPFAAVPLALGELWRR